MKCIHFYVSHANDDVFLHIKRNENSCPFMNVCTTRDLRITSSTDNQRACSQSGLVQSKFTDQPIHYVSSVVRFCHTHECIDLETNTHGTEHDNGDKGQ